MGTWFDNLPLHLKLLAILFFPLALSALAGSFFVVQVNELERASDILIENISKLQALSTISTDGERLANLSALVAESLTPAQAKDLQNKESQVQLEGEQALAAYEAATGASAPFMKNEFWRIIKLSSRINKDNNTGNVDDINGILSGDLPVTLSSFDKTINQSMGVLQKQEVDLIAQKKSIQKKAIRVNIGFFAVSFFLMILLVWLLFRGVARPVKTLAMNMSALAQGNVPTDNWKLNRHDEIGEMIRSFRIFYDNAKARKKLEEEAKSFHLELDMKLSNAEKSAKLASAEQTKLVKTMAQQLNLLAKGDLTTRFTDDVDFSYKALQADFNHATEKLEDTLQHINKHTATVCDDSDCITDMSKKLNHTASEQMRSMEEMTSVLEDIIKNIKKMTAGSVAMRMSARQARKQVETSNAILTETVEAMERIADSSGRISTIIATIDSIAFQTNLLALNAGVEAARAGETGRGFAVVATEVRALAQRSADAAREIKALISTSEGQVQTGVRVVGKTVESLKDIIKAVRTLEGEVAGVTQISETQSGQLDVVAGTLGMMRKTVFVNAEMAQEAAQASDRLSQGAGELNQMLGRFRVGYAGITL